MMQEEKRRLAEATAPLVSVFFGLKPKGTVMSGPATETSPNPSQTTPPPSTGSGTPPNGQNLQDADNPAWDPKTREYIASLRNENKDRRLEAQTLRQRVTEVETSHQALMGKLKGVGGGGEQGEELPPEEVIGHLQTQLEEQAAELAFIRGATSLGIVDERDQRYFQFLLNEHMADQEEGYEVPPDVLQQIVADVQSRSRGSNQAKPSGTSFGGANPPPPDGSTSEVTLEQFQKMGTIAKSQLYGRNPELYQQLLNQTKR